MATKTWSAAFLDPALNTLLATVNRLILCSGEPTTYNEAADTYRLAQADLTGADFTGPLNGSDSGRKLTIAQKPNVTVQYSGTAKYVALVDSTNLVLKYVGRINDYPVIAQTVITIAVTAIEIADPF